MVQQIAKMVDRFLHMRKVDRVLYLDVTYGISLLNRIFRERMRGNERRNNREVRYRLIRGRITRQAEKRQQFWKQMTTNIICHSRDVQKLNEQPLSIYMDAIYRFLSVSLLRCRPLLCYIRAIRISPISRTPRGL